jgi:hypothetical protein
MSKTVTIKQGIQGLASLVTNIDWSAVDADLFQKTLVENPVVAGREFTKFLQNGARMTFEIKNFPTWKTIELGTGLKTADDFRRALKDNGYRIGDWGNDILGQKAFTATKKSQSIDLVVISVADLGFEDGATRKDIYARAEELGLGLCPAEVGPQLRLQYKDQPRGEWLLIGMEPITDSLGYPNVFDVGHNDDGQWLDGSDGRPGSFWISGLRWVFVARK